MLPESSEMAQEAEDAIASQSQAWCWNKMGIPFICRNNSKYKKKKKTKKIHQTTKHKPALMAFITSKALNRNQHRLVGSKHETPLGK